MGVPQPELGNEEKVYLIEHHSSTTPLVIDMGFWWVVRGGSHEQDVYAGAG